MFAAENSNKNDELYSITDKINQKFGRKTIFDLVRRFHSLVR
jgi:hypothetical protein